MTVQELIDKLQKIEDKSLPIWGTGGYFVPESAPMENVSIEEPEFDYPRRVVIEE